VVGRSSRGGQLRMIVGRPNSDETSQVPRSAEVPSLGFDSSFIGQNLVEIWAPPLMAELRGRLWMMGLLPRNWPCGSDRYGLDM